jgi:hypothetical protein
MSDIVKRGPIIAKSFDDLGYRNARLVGKVPLVRAARSENSIYV